MEVSLVDSSDRSKEEYLERYEGVKSDIVDTTRFDESSDLNTTYLGNIIYDQKGLIFSLIEPKYLSFTSFCLVSTKASSGVLENVSLTIIW